MSGGKKILSAKTSVTCGISEIKIIEKKIVTTDRIISAKMSNPRATQLLSFFVKKSFKYLYLHTKIYQSYEFKHLPLLCKLYKFLYPRHIKPRSGSIAEHVCVIRVQ